MKTLPQIAIDCTRIEPSDGKCPYQLLDSEGEVIAELPAWVPYDRAPEVFQMVLGYEARGRKLGAEPEATEARFYYMHDCHLFTRLKGSTLDAIISHANATEANSGYGMLCPVVVMAGDKELRRVGPPAHSHGKNDPAYWPSQVAAWRESVEADPEVMRLIQLNPA